MQGRAHQGAALSETIIPDCLCFLPSSSPLLPHLPIPSFGSKHAVIYEQTQRNAQTKHVCYSSAHMCRLSENKSCSSDVHPHLPPSHSPTHQSPGEYQLQKIALFSRNHTPACAIVHVCVSLTVALHTMFRAVQPMSSGLSRILFILLLILKKLVARISL